MAKRESMDIPGLVPHKNPIPHVSRTGNMIFSGGIIGYDSDGNIPETLEEQTKCAFANMRKMVEGSGATLEDVAHVTVFLKTRANREPVNREWVALFPDEHSMPARHAVKSDLDDPMQIQLEFVAVL